MYLCSVVLRNTQKEELETLITDLAQRETSKE